MKNKTYTREELGAIDEEIELKLPFTTNYQKEAQKIVKSLWKDNNEVLHLGELWINTSIREVTEKEVIVYVLCDSTDEKVQLLIENFEKYIPPYDADENYKVRISNNNIPLIKTSMFAIMDSLYSIFVEVYNLHKEIININNSNLDNKSKIFFIRLAMEEVDESLEKEKYLLNFTYPKNILEDLNDLHLYHDWIEENDSFFISLALEAYRGITYFNEWIEKHQIIEKHFKEKKAKILNICEELQKHSKISLLTLPFHPQDTLNTLFFAYSEYYHKDKEDDAIQTIISIISNYKRIPKISKANKAFDKMLYFLETVSTSTKHNKYSKDEIIKCIFGDELIEKKIEFLNKIEIKLTKEEIETLNKKTAFTADSVFKLLKAGLL